MNNGLYGVITGPQPVSLSFVREFTAGNLAGLTYEDVIGFYSDAAATEWVSTINQKNARGEVNYRIVKWTVRSGVITGPPPVNDHTCTRCGNKKCSKTEKSCWSCGEPIPKEDHGSDPCCANPELSLPGPYHIIVKY